MTILTEQQKNLLDRIKNEGHKIGHLIGYKDLNEFHAKLINEIVCGKQNVSYCIHRCAYTSSTVCLGIALHILTKPDDKILLIVKNNVDVQNRLETIKQILESDEFQSLSCILWSRKYKYEVKIDKYNNLRITLGTIPWNYQLKIISSVHPLAGLHEKDLYIIDDIVNFSDVCSKQVSNHTLEVFNTVRKYAEDKRRRYILTGSTWCYDDIFQYSNDEDYIFDCYSTGLLTEERISEIRKYISPSIFTAQYLCNPFKEIYKNDSKDKLKELQKKLSVIDKKHLDLTDLKFELKDVVDNVELVYRNEKGRKL